MKDKIILITGATSGIGKAAALSLANLGAQIILHGRNELKTKQVQQEIISASGNVNVDIITADLFLQADIHKIAGKINGKYPHLDILINNAGGMMEKNMELTPDGKEKTIAINLFAPYLLSALLLNQLQKSPKARIINVSSSAHTQADPDFKDIQMTKKYSSLKAYGNSKLYQILMIQHFSKVLHSRSISNVTINAMNPGAVATNFLNKDFGFFLNLMGKLSRPFFKSPEKGAETIVYLATSDEVKNVSGKYFEDKKQVEVKPKFNSNKNEEIVWNYCEQETKMII